MAFSIKQVKAKLQEYGVPAESLDTAAEYFCAAHKTDLDAIKEERDTYKANAETLAAAKKELDELRAAGDGGLSVLQEKYSALEKEHKKLGKEYDQYKADQTAKETRNAKEKAYRALAKSALDPEGTGALKDSRIDTVIKSALVNGIIDGLELDENGAIKDSDKLKEAVESEWPEYIVSTKTNGADIPYPPANPGSTKMTKEEIDKIKDSGERIRAIAQNLDLYGAK